MPHLYRPETVAANALLAACNRPRAAIRSVRSVVVRQAIAWMAGEGLYV